MRALNVTKGETLVTLEFTEEELRVLWWRLSTIRGDKERKLWFDVASVMTQNRIEPGEGNENEM